MTDPFTAPHRLPVWQTLGAHAERLANTPLRHHFTTDPARFTTLSRQCGDLLVDFSKQRLDAAALADLLRLAEHRGLRAGISALFAADAVNFTEARPALHMAARDGCPPPAGTEIDPRPVRRFAAALRAGEIHGSTGIPIRTVINLGIGGSDLGPRMAAEALCTPHTHSAVTVHAVTVHFVANIDPRELDETLANAEPASTLFIVSSKSFSTAETLANAEAARTWLADAGIRETSAHFAAVSNATEAASAFGIAAERVFPLPEWIGGRYSVWSTIGLPLLIAVGETAFDAFLAGARAMDRHFADTPLADNLPVLMGLVGLWNADFLALDTLAVLPYAHGLRHFTAWLQQLEMESNGKRTLRDGTTTAVPTSPVIWGGVGTVGQHAFHQLLYQGTHTVPIDFIVPVGIDEPRQRALVDNALAQSAALMAGRNLDTARAALRHRGLTPAEVERLAPHLVCPGNQPSTTLLMPKLDAFNLGRLLALYEHKVFVQGWIWGINSFDQYGVELGKEMARALAAGAAGDQDASTAGLMAAAETIRHAAAAE